VEFPGAIYHVAVRMLGNWKKEENLLFEDDADRERFLSRLADRVEQYNIRFYLYCLLTNHVHLVFETPEGNCSKFMQSLSTAYTVYFNLRHGRHGHLVDGRYKAKLVEGDQYLLALSRYVHLNPAHVGGMKNKPIEERIRYLRQYPWSSYPSYIGRSKALDFVDYGPMLGQRSGQRRERPKRYRQFVESGLAESDPSSPGYDATSEDFKAALKESPRSIGSNTFRAWVDDLYQKLVETHKRPEDVSFRRITEPLAADAVLEILADVFGVPVDEFRQRRRNSPLRGVAARFLCRYAGLTQREVAATLQAGSGAAISQQMKKVAGQPPKDRRLRRLVEEAEERLNALRNDARRR
jgi:REP element-mobilizing transposase RayT